MWIAYQNNSGSPVWMVVGYYSPNCEGQDWAKKGWWRINPGASVTPLWTTNTNSLFYAEADDGRIWSGPYTTFIPYQVFDWCWNIASTANGEDVGMRLVTASNPWFPWTATINLT